MNLKDNTVRKFRQPSYNFSKNPTVTHGAMQYLFAATGTAEANTKNLPQPSTAQPPVPANGQTQPLALPPPTKGHAPGVGLRRGGAGAGATQLPNNIASRVPGNTDNTVHKSDAVEMVQGPDGVWRDPNDNGGTPNNVKPNIKPVGMVKIDHPSSLKMRYVKNRIIKDVTTQIIVIAILISYRCNCSIFQRICPIMPRRIKPLS